MGTQDRAVLLHSRAFRVGTSPDPTDLRPGRLNRSTDPISVHLVGSRNQGRLTAGATRLPGSARNLSHTLVSAELHGEGGGDPGHLVFADVRAVGGAKPLEDPRAA
jgi:hypothetical protein